jgi:hypothetical protein
MHKEAQSVIVRHKEYLGEIKGSIAYTVQQSFQINPGNSSTFPWFSGVANRFQEYKIRGMVFHYIPTSGDAVSSTNPALGSVMLATSYRATDIAPTSKIEMLNEYCSSETVPSEAVCHPIECDPKENPFNIQYVRSGNIPADDSRLLYDLGVTTVATSGQQIDNKVLGDLWVVYEIELKKPIVASNVTSTVTSMAAAYSTGITNSNFYTNLVNRWGSLDATASVKTVTFPKGALGYFMIITRWESSGTMTAFNSTGTVTYNNCTAVTNIGPGSLGPWTTFLGAGGGFLPNGYLIVACLITDPALQASVVMPTITLTGTVDTVQLQILPFVIS